MTVSGNLSLQQQPRLHQQQQQQQQKQQHQQSDKNNSTSNITNGYKDPLPSGGKSTTTTKTTTTPASPIANKLQHEPISKPTTLFLDENDLIKLDKFDKFLNHTKDDKSFPMLFTSNNDNNNDKSFKMNRQISYALKKLSRNIYNKKISEKSFQVEIKKNQPELKSFAEETEKPQQQEQQRAPVITTKWSQVVQQGALRHSKTNSSTTIDSGKRSETTSSSPSQQQQQQQQRPMTIMTSNALQPLGIVSLRLMYDKTYADLFSTSSLPKTHSSLITPHGLINTGNICYMNSVMQMLLYCAPFNRVLGMVQAKTIANLTGTNSRTPLLDATILFMNEFTKPGEAPLSPETFYHSLSLHPRFKHLKWGQQEDLEEFLGYLLDGLHEEFVDSIKILTKPEVEMLIKSVGGDVELKMAIMNAVDIVKKSKTIGSNEKINETRIKNNSNNNNDGYDNGNDDDGWLEVGSNKKIAAKRTVEIKPSPITLLFGGQFRSVLEVPRQKESKSITLDPFQHVQLDISDSRVVTLEDLFKLFSEPESISYKSSNGNEVIARKQNFIDKLPNLLIIHLKRFSFVVNNNDKQQYYNYPQQNQQQHLHDFQQNNFKIEKLRKRVFYSHDLELPLECISLESRRLLSSSSSPSNCGGNNNRYKLTAVVYHHGMSPEGGHYTCDVMKQTQQTEQQQQQQQREKKQNQNGYTQYEIDDDENLNKTKNYDEWIRIDDGVVLPLNRDEVLDTNDDVRNAYILMYQRVL